MHVVPDPDTKVLNLWKQHLGQVPDYVCTLRQLETLILADNDLTALPDAIGTLTRLRTLDLGHNALAELPESIGGLVGLRDFLYLHDNQLTGAAGVDREPEAASVFESQRESVRLGAAGGV